MSFPGWQYSMHTVTLRCELGNPEALNLEPTQNLLSVSLPLVGSNLYPIATMK